MVQKRTLFIAILDADPKFTEHLSELLKRIFKGKEQPVEIHVFRQTCEADNAAQTYDLLFMDVELGEENGIDWAFQRKHVRKYGEIIITTAYDGDVFESLKLRPFAFVRKRLLEVEIAEALERYLNERSDKQPVCVIIMDGKKLVPIDPYEIRYIRANGHYLDIFVESGMMDGIRNTLNEVQNVLQDYGFIRVQVSYLVNISYVEKIEHNVVYLKNGISKRISPQYREELWKRLKYYMKS